MEPTISEEQRIVFTRKTGDELLKEAPLHFGDPPQPDDEIVSYAVCLDPGEERE